MERVRVDTPSSAYDVLIGHGILGEAMVDVLDALQTPDLVVVTDARVDALFGDTVVAALEAAGARVGRIAVASGEASKSWPIAGDVLERMVALGLDRRSGLVALGGGVVGDLAGFCAAVYMRGIPFVQVPTTLLAQVDSSVGGKTAVDLPAGKNLVGSFAQPRLVVADTATLSSLPESEWLSGLGEVVKHGFLGGEELLAWTESHARELTTREPDTIEHAVRQSVRFKAGVVSADERESGGRESLNYGHTLGHAIETLAGYGTYPHGVAVGEGIRFAARLAERVVGAAHEFTLRQDRLLDTVGLTGLDVAFDPERVKATMAADKKAHGGRPRFVLLPRPGEFVVTEVDDEILSEELESWAARREVGQ